MNIRQAKNIVRKSAVKNYRHSTMATAVTVCARHPDLDLDVIVAGLNRMVVAARRVARDLIGFGDTTDSVVVSYDDTSLGNWEIVPGSVEVPG